MVAKGHLLWCAVHKDLIVEDLGNRFLQIVYQIQNVDRLELNDDVSLVW